jgi:hypothetical protein
MARTYTPRGKYELTSLIAVVLLLLIVFVSVSYFFFFVKPGEGARQRELTAELESNLALWNSARPSAFRYVVDRRCDCQPEDEMRFVVTVQAGKRTAEFPIPVESSEGVLINVPPHPIWIEDVFALVAQAVRNGAEVEVRYHQRYGFPEFLDLTKEGSAAEQYEIRDIEVIE